jgi:TonB family protein
MTMLAAPGLVASEPANTEPSGAQSAADAAPAGQVAFDIQAQPLASALEAYSVTAGREVVYNGKLAIGRQSAGVRGVFTPETALQVLLDGTGLSPRYMAADAFMLVPAVGDAPAADTVPPLVASHYYGRIQASLKHAFCADSRTRPGDYRVAASFWIGPSGRVARAELLGSTGDSTLDSAIGRAIRSMAIGAPPPPGFAQPVTLMVAPRSAGMTPDCQAEPVRAAGP